MYTEFFGLNEKPFSITPDPRYLYLSRRHADALAHLIYGISESGGFIQLTGEVGTGKTTLIRSVLEQLPEQAEIALLLNPQLSPTEFLESICVELRVPLPADGSVRALIAALNEYLLRAHAQGRRIVLIVDEAQTLGPELLEQVRLLTNLETSRQKLLQIILIGQPELRAMLDRAEMRQVAQRVTGRFHLEPLSAAETAAYIKHRLRVAGCQAGIFTRRAVRELYRRSGGIPRLINVVADRALLAAYTQDRTRVDGKLVKRAAIEVFGRRLLPRYWPWAATAAVAAAAAFAVLGPLQQSYGPLGGSDQAAPGSATGSGNSSVAPSLAGRPEMTAAPTERQSARTELQSAPSEHQSPRAPRVEAQAEAEPSPAEPTRVSLGQLLERPDTATDTDSAFAQLFALWSASFDPIRGEACLQAAEQRLRCTLLEGGGLDRLRGLNRPAILTLVDGSGGTHDVVVSRLRDGDAWISMDGTPVSVDAAELERHWTGDHLILWRPHVRVDKPLIRGVRDIGVPWLRKGLARLRGEELATAPSLLFDAELETDVRRYQRDKLLTVDGIAGEMTQLALTSDLGLPAEPTLHGEY